MKIEIQKASVKDAEIIAPMFDAYRMFYKQVSDIDGAIKFILMIFLYIHQQEARASQLLC